jgi:Na+(H+)/acetate symporter ActP
MTFTPISTPRVVTSLIGIAAGLIAGVGLPLLEVGFACRRSISEGCVWGRALIGINIVATLVVVGIPVGLMTAWLVSRRRRMSNRHD